MRVELIDYSLAALELLIFTKNTRLRGEFPTLESVIKQPYEWKMEQIAYIRDTIQSSWEFVDYIFKIDDVSRNFTHQSVRTRTASFAQESQRATDLSDAEFYIPHSISEDADAIGAYNIVISASRQAYNELIEYGINRQDARNVIPTGVLTSIIVKMNLRTLHDTAELRLCYRTQGEYQEVFKEMKRQVVRVHPWAEDFINVYCVNHATCAFPRYTECPIQCLTFQNPTLAIYKENIKRVHDETIHESNPVARDGKTT